MLPGVILSFGTFDGLHQGHEYFLKQAKDLGVFLVAGVARDSHVRALKNKEPKQNEEARCRALLESGLADQVILCDEELGSFEIIRRVDPQIVALGHDQLALEQSIKKWIDQNQANLQIKKIDCRLGDKIPLTLKPL